MTFGPKLVLAALAALCLAVPASADNLRADYEAQVGYTLHLLEAGRYGEAEDAAQALVTAYPDVSLPYAVRGTAALYVGSVGFARKDFNRIALENPDPATLYGVALCHLFAKNTETAKDRLGEASRQPGLTDTQKSDVAAAMAYTVFLTGHLAEAKKLAAQSGGADDSLGAEVAALALLKTDHKAGEAALAKFTAAGGLKVREQDGLHPLFDPQTPLEPCVIPRDLQQMYADRLSGCISASKRTAGEVQQCSGIVDLNPPPTLPSRTALLSYCVDGHMAAMVSQPPYTFTWNTVQVANGTHTVQIEAVDAFGNALTTQTETVRVSNKNGAAARQADDLGMTALKTRLWNLLALRPSRKVAEWTLAQAALASGNTAASGSHLENAAALDPAYKNGRATARALFGPPPALLSLSLGSSTLKQIALTFDDGPSLTRTPALLDALDTAHAPATFFVVGSRAAEAPALLQRMAKRGDEVENHSFTHPNMNLLLLPEAEAEIVRGSVVIQALTGKQPHFFRPPGGNASPAIQHLAQSYGLSMAYWTVDAVHYEDLGSPNGLVNYVLAHAHSGSIVLMHNGPDVTTTAIPALVAGLRARGYSLVTLAEIAKGQTNTAAKTAPKMKE